MRMAHQCAALLMCGAIGAAAVAGGGDWVDYTDETDIRLDVANGLGANDPDEKDYAWADLDQDGDIDFIVVRKQIGSNSGARRNVLFMNEDGVLVDRTVEYASAADEGGQGFLDNTPDRDVALVDVDGDGWLDIVTVPAGAYANLPKTISHPRIFMNLGNDGKGVWQGFMYEEARIPQLVDDPNFCGVGFGDVDDDGDADLYFGDYFNNLEDRLLLNDGAGNFDDMTNSRFSGNTSFLNSEFTSHVVIADLNGDGYNDIIKNSSLNPYEMKISYNDPNNPGFFTASNVDVILNGSDYFVSVGDLNNDGLLDVVEVDDGSDRYFLNEGNDGNGEVNWHAGGNGTTFNNTGGFGSNAIMADLNGDGFNDVLIADVDVDLWACGGNRLKILRNNANPPTVTFVEDPANLPPQENQGAPLAGTHDVAAFDINGDSWVDLIVGTCAGTTVFMNSPPVGADFTYPNGIPDLLTPGEATTVDVDINVVGAKMVPGSASLFAAINDGGFAVTPMDPLGGSLFRATLPAADCLDNVSFYFSVQLQGNGEFTDPAAAPASTYVATATDGVKTIFNDDVEGDTSSWTMTVADATSGDWEQADPEGTTWNGNPAAPADDNTPAGTMAFVTQNGEPGDLAFNDDVDGGPVTLISPLIDLGSADGVISYARWFFSDSDGNDQMTVEVSNDGGDHWTIVETVAATNQASWQTASFRVGLFVEPTEIVMVRFVTSDNPNDSITEAAIDDFQVDEFTCGAGCPADLDGDGAVGSPDLIALLGAWGKNPGHPADFDGDNIVGTTDLLALLGAWGPCP